MPERDLKIVLLPIDTIEFDSNSNIDLVDTLISGLAADTDLVILPEMFNSGFSTDESLLRSAAEAQVDTILRLEKMAEKNGLAISGSMIAAEGDHFVNRGFIIDPDTVQTHYYDKRHTFSLGGESKVIGRGSQKSPIVNFRGWNLAMAICYDIRFPVWTRSRANEYDLLIVPANWPDSRNYAWRHLLIARAIENQAFVAGCNRCGSDSYGAYSPDNSYVFDFSGRETGSRFPNGIVEATLSASALEAARKHFAPWRDADDFSINY